MRYYLTFVVGLLVLLSGCASLGTSTFYKVPDKISIQRIGFASLNPDSIPPSWYFTSNENYSVTAINTWQKYYGNSAQYIDSSINFHTPDANAIARLCDAMQLDGIVLTSLKFIDYRYFYLFIPIGQDYETVVQMKLYSSKGKLLVSNCYVTHDGGRAKAKGSKLERAVTGGTIGAVRGLIQEIQNPGEIWYQIYSTPTYSMQGGL